MATLDNQTSAAVALKRPPLVDPGQVEALGPSAGVVAGLVPATSTIFAPRLKTWIVLLEPGLLVVKRVIPGHRSEAEASPESIFPDLWLWIPGPRPAAEPRNDWTKVLPEHASSV